MKKINNISLDAVEFILSQMFSDIDCLINETDDYTEDEPEFFLNLGSHTFLIFKSYDSDKTFVAFENMLREPHGEYLPDYITLQPDTVISDYKTLCRVIAAEYCSLEIDLIDQSMDEQSWHPEVDD